ncbi:MAG: PilN domain-containing protein, partial [Chloroflexi bacterium]|nr:PilN domain-containing protein [Chloroflexota bacterium]
ILSEVLETIPFDERDVDVAWQYRPNDNGNEVFATAVPKTVVDDHIEVLRGLNVQPSAAYSRGTALAYAVGVPNAIVVHLAPEHSAAVLVRERAPQIIQELGLPEEAAGVERRIEVISHAVEQVGSYYQPLNGRNEEPLPPVIVTGEFSAESGLIAKLRIALSNEVISYVATGIVYPDHFPPQEYAVNIGLALGDRARTKLRKKIRRDRGPTVNLLSQRHLPRPWPVWPAASFMTILMLVVVAINFTPLVGNLEVEAATLSKRLDNLKRQERNHRLEQGLARATQERILSFELLTESLLGHLGLLEEDLDILLLRAEQITRDALIPSVAVNSFSQQGGEFGLTGTAGSYEDVLQYTSNLRETGVFDEVRIVRISRANTADSDVAFQIKITAEPVLKEDEADKGAPRRR